MNATQDPYDIADEMLNAWVAATERDWTGDRYAISAAFKRLTGRQITEGSFTENLLTLAETGKTLSGCRQSAA